MDISLEERERLLAERIATLRKQFASKKRKTRMLQRVLRTLAEPFVNQWSLHLMSGLGPSRGTSLIRRIGAWVTQLFPSVFILHPFFKVIFDRRLNIVQILTHIVAETEKEIAATNQELLRFTKEVEAHEAELDEILRIRAQASKSRNC